MTIGPLESDPEWEDFEARFALGQGEVRSSALFSGGTAIVRQGVQFVGILILARLLGPHAFGLAVIVQTVILFAQNFTDLGIGPAVARRPTLSKRFVASAFWANLLSGILLTVIGIALAVPLSKLFHSPELERLFALASLNFTLSVYVVHTALMERALRFREIGLIEVGAMTIGMTAGVTVALLGGGAISIVLASLVTTTAQTALYWWRVKWVPGPRLGAAELIELWRFSSWLVAFNVTNYWTRSADNLLLGRYASPATLGVYARAYDLMLAPVQQVSTVLIRVMIPALAAVRDDTARLRDRWLRSVHAAWITGLPLSVGSCVAAPALIETLYGHKWSGAAPILAILSIATPPQLIGRMLGAVFQVFDRTANQFWLGLATGVITVGLIVAGLPWGARGVAVGAATGLIVTVTVTTNRVLQLIGSNWPTLLHLLWRSGVAGGLAFAAALAPRVLGMSAPAPVMLVVQTALLTIVYVVALFALDRRQVRLTVGRLRRGAEA